MREGRKDHARGGVTRRAALACLLLACNAPRGGQLVDGCEAGEVPTADLCTADCAIAD